MDWITFNVKRERDFFCEPYYTVNLYKLHSV